jgi:hypothetical protein
MFLEYSSGFVLNSSTRCRLPILSTSNIIPRKNLLSFKTSIVYHLEYPPTNPSLAAGPVVGGAGGGVVDAMACAAPGVVMGAVLVTTPVSFAGAAVSGVDGVASGAGGVGTATGSDISLTCLHSLV